MCEIRDEHPGQRKTDPCSTGDWKVVPMAKYPTAKHKSKATKPRNCVSPVEGTIWTRTPCCTYLAKCFQMVDGFVLRNIGNMNLENVNVQHWRYNIYIYIIIYIYIFVYTYEYHNASVSGTNDRSQSNVANVPFLVHDSMICDDIMFSHFPPVEVVQHQSIWNPCPDVPPYNGHLQHPLQENSSTMLSRITLQYRSIQKSG